MENITEILDNTNRFERATLEPILFKHGFKIGEKKNEEQLYYNKTHLTYIKYEYNFLKLFYKGNLLRYNDFAVLKVFIFATHLSSNDITFLNNNISNKNLFLEEVKSISELKDKVQKEIDSLNKSIKLSISVCSEKANIKKRTNTKEHYEKIMQQIEDFVL